MSLFTHLLLLVLSHSVSADLKEKQLLYHVHTVHYNPLQNTSNNTEFSSADTENMTSEWMKEFWKSKTGKKEEEQRSLHEPEVIIQLLEIRYGAGDLEKTHGCELEKFSGGAVTLSTSAESRSDEKILFYFNVDSVQCVIMDSEVFTDKIMQNSSSVLNQFTKDYLVHRCMERLFINLDQCNKDRRGTVEVQSSEEDKIVSFYTLLLLCFTFWVVYKVKRKKEEREEGRIVFQGPCNPPDPDIIRWRVTKWINSVFLRIKRKIRKRKTARSAFEGGVNVNALDEDRVGVRVIHIRRRIVASMDIPLTLADEEEEEGSSVKAGLTTAGERFAASMDIPLTLAGDEEDEDDGDIGERLFHITSLNRAGGTWRLKNVSLPNLALERNDVSDG